MGRYVEHKRIIKGITRIEKRWERDNDVAIKLWFDMAPVFFMTTIHGIRWDQWPYFPAIMRARHRPKEASTAPANIIHNFDIPVNKAQARFFLEHNFQSSDLQLVVKEFKRKATEFHTGRIMQPVDEVADFYNHGMNSCDVANQFRAHLVCQLITVKS